MRRRWTRIVLAASLALPAALSAQDEPSRSPAAESAWQRYFRKQMGAYELKLRADGEQRDLTRYEEPVLRWTQPVRGGDDGACYLWLDGDRPAALVAVLAWPTSGGEHVVQHEWQLLAESPLEARRGGSRVWSPGRATIEWRPIPEAPRPAATEAARRLQLGRLARRFSGYDIDSEGKKWELRPLTQPLYRFDRGDAASGKPAAGGLFALVEGTDPEALLLIEADGDSWRYAASRLTYRAIEVLLDGEQVLEIPAPPTGTRDPSSDYVILRIEQRAAPTDEPPAAEANE